MRRHTTLIAMLAGALAIFAVLAAGCGDDDSNALTLEEYFSRFEAIDAGVDQEIEALYAEFPDDESDEEFFANEENFELLKGLFTGFPVVVQGLVDDLGDLNPPSEVEDAHTELLDAGRGLLQAFENANAGIDSAETIADLEAINQGAEIEIAPAEQRFDAACLAVVAVAEANDIAIDVSCVDEG